MSLNDLYMPHGQHRTKKDARLITALISVHVDVNFSRDVIVEERKEIKERNHLQRGYLENINLLCGG